jgi:hypothetical protein
MLLPFPKYVVTRPFNGFFLNSLLDLAAPVPVMHLDGELTVPLERCSRCSSCPDDAAINPVTHARTFVSFYY